MLEFLLEKNGSRSYSNLLLHVANKHLLLQDESQKIVRMQNLVRRPVKSKCRQDGVDQPLAGLHDI